MLSADIVGRNYPLCYVAQALLLHPKSVRTTLGTKVYLCQRSPNTFLDGAIMLAQHNKEGNFFLLCLLIKFFQFKKYFGVQLNEKFVKFLLHQCVNYVQKISSHYVCLCNLCKFSLQLK
jgi:hypothetical protein